MATAVEEHPAIPEETPSLSSYLLRFGKLCSREVLSSEVLEFKNQLSLRGFRSIFWARWLNIFTVPDNWVKEARTGRGRFNKLRKKHLDDKRLNPDLHPEVNNPLCLDGPWGQFFLDDDLRKVIERDVVRSVSEEVRRHEQIKERMTTILFIYGKEHPDLTYRQGMHEILSSILLLRLDEITFCQKIVTSQKSSTLMFIQELLDAGSVEADVFILFEKVMEYMWDWYYTLPTPQPIENGANKHSIQDNPFDEKKSTFDSHPVSNAAKRLQNMWENILQLHDKQLFNHLDRLNILPTTFGVNWTKLLFTRQFLQNFLEIWDAVIVSKFTLVDYIVVAMVLAVRQNLLQGDSNTCNMILVSKYPTKVCPKYIIKMALHLQDSKAFKKPTGEPFISESEISFPVEILGEDDFAYELPKEELSIHDKNDLISRMRAHHLRLQRSLNEVSQALDKSYTDKAKVRLSLNRMQYSLDVMNQDLMKKDLPTVSRGGSHRRNTSMAFDALAYNT